MVVFEVIGWRLVAVYPSLHDRGRAKRGGRLWVQLEVYPLRSGRDRPGMADREKIAGIMPSETQSRSAKANEVTQPVYGQPLSWRVCYP